MRPDALPCVRCHSPMESGVAGHLRCRSCGHQAAADGAWAGWHLPIHPVDTVLAAAGQLAARPSRELVCVNCGGHTELVDGTLSTRCAFCGSDHGADPTDAPGRLPVDAVIPFAVDEVAAVAATRRWQRWQLPPRSFIRSRDLTAPAGVFLSHMTFTAQVEAAYAGRRGIRVRRGKRTHTRWEDAAGHVAGRIDHHPVPAVVGVDADRLADLAPWPVQSAVPYSPAQVAGRRVRTHDLSIPRVVDAGHAALTGRVEQMCRDDMGGDRQKVSRTDIVWDAVGVTHLLMPVWIAAISHEGAVHQVLVNALTGEVSADAPTSRVKVTVLAVLALVVVLWALANGEAR